MLGTAQRQFAADWRSTDFLIPALACAGALLVAFLTDLRAALVACLLFLVAALSTRAWRGALLLAALVAGHAAFTLHERLELRITEPLTLNQRVVEVISVRPSAGRSPARLRVRDRVDGREYLLGAWDAKWIPQPRQCLSAQLRLRPPVGTNNFQGFDYGRWLFTEGIAATGSIRDMQPCEPASTTLTAAESALDQLPAGPGRALLKALLTADRSEFDAPLWETLARTGTSHLFAISGLHVGLVAAMAGGVGYLLWMTMPGLPLHRRRKPVVLLTSIVGVVAYMGVAAGQVSAQRAGLSALLVLGLLLGGRRISALRVWSLALMLVLLWNPSALLGPALGLSFTASLILLVALPRLQGLGFPRQLLLVQLILGIGMAPLVAAYFGQWSAAGLGLNLVLVPALAIVLPLSLVAFALANFWNAPLQWMAELLGAGYAGLQTIGAQSWAALPIRDLAFPYALAMVVLFLLLTQMRSYHHAMIVAGLWLAAGVMALWPAAAPEFGAARLWMLDVGQGQAVVMQTHRHWVLVDAGPRSPRGSFDAGAMIVQPHLQAFGAQQIDLLVLTHGDLDHAGGAGALEQTFPVLERWGFAGKDCEQGLSWAADGVVLRSWPVGARPEWTDNNRSCVVEILVGPRRLLLTGDIEESAEQGLLARTEDLSFDVVTVPHHGSASSSSAAWVQRQRVSYALISAGRFNRWGFPVPEVRQRWQLAGAEVLNTAEGGAIALELPRMQVRRPPDRLWHSP